MTYPEPSPPPAERQPFDASVVRAAVLAMLAIIVGSTFAYELARSTSPSTPIPKPRRSAPRRRRSRLRPTGVAKREPAAWLCPRREKLTGAPI
jgi:hypothetical protein